MQHYALSVLQPYSSFICTLCNLNKNKVD